MLLAPHQIYTSKPNFDQGIFYCSTLLLIILMNGKNCIHLIWRHSKSDQIFKGEPANKDRLGDAKECHLLTGTFPSHGDFLWVTALFASTFYIFWECMDDWTHLELWHGGEYQHEDGGQQEEGANHHQHLWTQGKKKKGNYQQKIHLCCCGWVWVLKSFPNFISQSCTAHSLKLVILDHGPIRLKIAMMNWAGLALILKLPLPTNQLTRSSWSSPWSTIGSSQEALWSVYAQQGSVKLIVMNVVIIVTNLLYQDRGSWGPSTPAPPGSPWGTRSLSGAAHPSCRAPRYSRKPGVGDQSRTPLFQVKRSHIEREFQLKEKKLKLIDSQDNNWFWSLLPWSA